MSLKQLPTAVEWPAHWRNIPLWALFERIKDVGHPDEEMLSVYRAHGVVKKDARDDNNNKTAENRNIYQLVDKGWLIVNRMKAWQGSVGISPYRGIVSGHYLCFKPRHGEDPRFLNWLLRSDAYAIEYARLSRGVRPGQIEIDNDELRGLRVALPPVDEQRRIADFLDAETAQIDRLADLRTSQQKLVGDRGKAYLSQFADELSARYGMVRVRHVLQKIEQGWSPQCEDRLATEMEWGVVKAGCVNGGVFDPGQHKALPPAVEPELRYRLRPGDLLMSRASGSVDLIGSISVLPDDMPCNLLLCDKIYRMKVDRTRVEPNFVAHMLTTHRVREQIKLGISGADGMANNLPTATVVNLPIPDAPRKEQDRVVAEILRHRNSTKDAQMLLDRQLSLLAERRQALITAAVTGQLDVTTARRNIGVSA